MEIDCIGLRGLGVVLRAARASGGGCALGLRGT
jgi:hypothetical protein